MLRALKARGLRAPRRVIADARLGIWGAVGLVFPTVEEQRCWNHRIVNVLDTLPKQLQVPARELLTKIPYAETRGEAERLKQAFQAWAAKKGVPAAGRRLEEDWERLVTFYAFPAEHWKHLRTTNVVESPFAPVRLRTTAAKRFKKDATTVIWKTLLVAERSFRRLDSPELLPEVAEGVVYVDGVREKRGNEKAAA
jgi:transposase-like protein